MAVLTEFTKEMLLRSSYGDKNRALDMAIKLSCTYKDRQSNPVCRSRYESLIRIIGEVSEK